ncbi:hypothetical protein MYSE111917_22590 [Mycobacterium senriense]|nr:hypothetical protein [Mycobacterium senriense]
MSSIDAPLNEAAHSRFLSSRFDSLTPSTLLAISERYARNGLSIGGRSA